MWGGSNYWMHDLESPQTPGAKWLHDFNICICRYILKHYLISVEY